MEYSCFSKPKAAHDFADSKMHLNAKVIQNFSNWVLQKSLLGMLRQGFRRVFSYHVTVFF